MTENGLSTTQAAPLFADASARFAGVRRAAWWMAWCLPTTALAIVPHELGHLVFMKVFGFPNVRMHFASASDSYERVARAALRAGDVAKAESLAPLWKFAIVSGAGILVSYIVIIGCILLARRKLHPFLVSLGLISTLRFQLGFTIFYDHLINGKHYISGTDEGMVGATSFVSENVLWVIGIPLVAAAWILLIRALPRGERIKHFALTAVGTAAGFLLYVRVLGPVLLP